GPTRVRGSPAALGEVMADPAHPLRPRRAIGLGRPPLSRPVVTGLRGAGDVEVIVVDPHLDWADVARRAQLVVPAATGAAQGSAAGGAPLEEGRAAPGSAAGAGPSSG